MNSILLTNEMKILRHPIPQAHLFDCLTRYLPTNKNHISIAASDKCKQKSDAEGHLYLDLEGYLCQRVQTGVAGRDTSDHCLKETFSEGNDVLTWQAVIGQSKRHNDWSERGNCGYQSQKTYHREFPSAS